MFCPNCGNKILDKAKYCSKCGAKLPDNLEIYAQYKECENIAGDKEKNSKRFYIITVMTMMALVIICVSLVAVKNFYKNKENYTEGIQNWVTAENLRTPGNISNDSVEQIVSLLIPPTISNNVSDMLKIYLKNKPLNDAYSSFSTEGIEETFSEDAGIENGKSKIEFIKLNSAQKINKTILRYYQEKIYNSAWDLVISDAEKYGTFTYFNRDIYNNVDNEDTDVATELFSDSERKQLNSDEAQLYAYLLTMKISEGYTVNFTYSKDGKEKNKSFDLLLVDGLWMNSDTVSNILLEDHESWENFRKDLLNLETSG